jgi:hypothetical protein
MYDPCRYLVESTLEIIVGTMCKYLCCYRDDLEHITRVEKSSKLYVRSCDNNNNEVF